MEYIQKCLKILEPLKPIETGTETKISKGNFKAVIFDIYGTLLVSSSGDIDKAEISTAYLKQALDGGGYSLTENGSMSENDKLVDLLKKFRQQIEAEHTFLKSKGYESPEIEIIDIWTKVLDKVDYVIAKEANLKRMAFIFELLSNKIYPMPHMKQILDDLLGKKIPLGIVSNAQFYTPVIMNFFLTDFMYEKEFITGFDEDLCVFSYKINRAKPDVGVFDTIVEGLKERGIAPDEALFVGNDMLKDVYTASQAGLKTCLFAGDKRSLRWRENDERVKGLKPDYIIDDLNQLSEIVN